VGGTRAPWPLEACRWSNGGDLRGVKMDGVTWPDPGFWPAIRPEGVRSIVWPTQRAGSRRLFPLFPHPGHQLHKLIRIR
jgi:hypothetical protein